MKKEDYFGKFILRDGDLKPCEIDKFSWKKYDMSERYLSYLESQGLLFDNMQEAMMHYRCIMGAMKKPVDEREFNNLVPVWRRAFEMCSETGKEPVEDKYMLDEQRGILIKIQKGSFTAQCLILKELDKLPKEIGL